MFNKIIRVLNKELSQLYFTIIQSYPDSHLGKKLRKNYWKKKSIKLSYAIKVHEIFRIGFFRYLHYRREVPLALSLIY